MSLLTGSPVRGGVWRASPELSWSSLVTRHRSWVAAAFAVCGLFGLGVTLVSSDHLHRMWGLMAACGYALATVATRPGAPYALALDQTRGVLYVTLTASNELESFRFTGTTVVPDRVWPTVRQPDAVAVDPATGRVFVASRTGGGLELIDP